MHVCVKEASRGEGYNQNRKTVVQKIVQFSIVVVVQWLLIFLFITLFPLLVILLILLLLLLLLICFDDVVAV